MPVLIYIDPADWLIIDGAQALVTVHWLQCTCDSNQQAVASDDLQGHWFLNPLSALAHLPHGRSKWWPCEWFDDNDDDDDDDDDDNDDDDGGGDDDDDEDDEMMRWWDDEMNDEMMMLMMMVMMVMIWWLW